jgi:hypothetical protein
MKPDPPNTHTRLLKQAKNKYASMFEGNFPKKTLTFFAFEKFHRIFFGRRKTRKTNRKEKSSAAKRAFT